MSLFPKLQFDTAVTGGVQLDFGVENPVVSYVDGSLNFTDYILSISQKKLEQTLDTKPEDIVAIPQGQRNIILHKSALRILTRYGMTDEAWIFYLKEVQRCSPPLEEREVQGIWYGALAYYKSTIRIQPDYIEPDKYQKISEVFQWEIPPVNYVAVQQLYSIGLGCQKV